MMRALFIDDDALNRTVMAAMLAVADVHMDEAAHGLEGLQRIDVVDYDFVLVDLRMPHIDGFEVIGRIRARPDAKARLPIVVVTADSGELLAERCRAAGADELLTKPVEMDHLFEIVGRLLADRRDGTV